MQSIWCPAPVLVLFRRLVNVVSTLSISHQYLLHCNNNNSNNNNITSAGRSSPRQPLPCPAHAWTAFRTIEWLPWISGTTSSGLSLSLQGGDHLSSNQGDLPDIPPPPPPPPPRPSSPSSSPPPPPPDTLHQLLHSPLLFDPVRKPRYPIVLCHGQSSVSPFFFRLPELTFCMPSWKVYMASMSVAQLRFPCSGHTTGRMCSMYSGELSAPRSSSPAFPALAPS